MINHLLNPESHYFGDIVWLITFYILNHFFLNSVINRLLNPESHYFGDIVPVVSLPPLVMINPNSPPNSLINVIQKIYNSFNGVISNIICQKFAFRG